MVRPPFTQSTPEPVLLSGGERLKAGTPIRPCRAQDRDRTQMTSSRDARFPIKLRE